MLQAEGGGEEAPPPLQGRAELLGHSANGRREAPPLTRIGWRDFVNARPFPPPAVSRRALCLRAPRACAAAILDQRLLLLPPPSRPSAVLQRRARSWGDAP